MLNVSLNDELTVRNIRETYKMLSDSLENNSEIVVDLSGVETIDVAAVQLLVAVRKECDMRGIKVSFKMSGPVSDMLSLLGVRL
jgi:anti-anti-sigma regulatory factor